jgi:hypothetical protein
MGFERYKYPRSKYYLLTKDSRLSQVEKQRSLTEITFGSCPLLQAGIDNTVFAKNCFQAEWQHKGYPDSCLAFYRKVY